MTVWKDIAMRAAIPALAALLFAAPASAQVQYWLPNGPGGTTYNNPQGSLSGTYYEHELRRYADRQRWARERAQAGGGQGGGQGGSANYGGPQTASLDPSFRLNNLGGRAIREVYVSSSQDNSWGPDRLGQNVLGSGQQMVIRLRQGQCVNDVRVVFMDGQAQERRQVNTCALTDLGFR